MALSFSRENKKLLAPYNDVGTVKYSVMLPWTLYNKTGSLVLT